MKRKEQRRAEMLSAFVKYLLRHGLRDLSLRPAAAALGTSPRMLLYYFGSKERLLIDAIASIRTREDARFAEEVQRQGGRPASEVVWASWQWFTSKRRERYLRLFYETYGLAVANPRKFKNFIDAAGADYFPIMQEGLRGHGFSAAESQVAATLFLGTLRGLMMDLLTTGDRTRIDAAVRQLAADIERRFLDPAPRAGTSVAPHPAADLRDLALAARRKRIRRRR